MDATYPNNQTPESTCIAGGFPLLWTAFSLVPIALIEEENPDLWVNFLRERVPHDQVISSVVFEEDGLCFLYEANKNQEHVISYLLSWAHHIPADEKFLCVRENERLAIVCYKAGQLQLGNIFEATSKEQALYWILKTYEQIGISESTPIYITCDEGTCKLLRAHLDTRELTPTPHENH